MSDLFYLFANCNFVPDKYNDWQAAYDGLAEYVWKSEHTTMTYYFGIPIDYAHDFSKTTSMFAFEIYKSREGLYKSHLGSPAMQKFLGAIPPCSTTGLDLSHYSLINGFLDLPDDMRECGIMQDTRIACVSPQATDSVIDALAALTASVEKKERQDERKNYVYTYMAFKSLDDETGARIFGRWRDREAMEGFLRMEEIVGFWMNNKEHIKSMECRGYLPNGKGWLHR